MSDTGVSGQTGGLSADAYAEKIFAAVLGCMETYSVYLGDRLGWFSALADGPLTAAKLAQRTSTIERYAVEWLEMQAVYGNLLVVDDAQGVRNERRFALPAGAAEVLTDTHSLSYLGAYGQFAAAVGAQLDTLAAAYRDGGGVSWAALGPGARSAQAALNRPWFENRLAPALAGVAPLQAVLVVDGARMADVDCGAGWSTIALAKAYPFATVVGFHIDAPSIDMARRAGGAVVIMDEAVADTFTASGGVAEKAMYGFSILICLPDGLSSTPSAGTGTVLRRSILTDYATRAGFADVDVLPIEDFGFFRFCALR
jgi:hypothetical protein